MKRFKHFTIDEEIAEELDKEKNASKIVNNLLKDYYNESSNLKKQELKNKLIHLEAETKKSNESIKIIKEQIKKMITDEKRLKEVFKNIPKEIMDDFRYFNKMTLDSLLKRYKEIYSRKFNIKWEELKKAFCKLRGLDKDGNQI